MGLKAGLQILQQTGKAIASYTDDAARLVARGGDDAVGIFCRKPATVNPAVSRASEEYMAAVRKLDEIISEKMVLTILPENLTFKEAETVEEGIQFAKKVLNISDVGSNFSLDAINFINKALVDVSNANKGRLFMPKALRFEKLDDMTLANVRCEIGDNDFAKLTINSRWFDDSWLQKQIENYFKNAAGILVLDDVGIKTEYHTLNPTEKLASLIKKFFKGESLTINEKRNIYFNLREPHKKIWTDIKPEQEIDIGFNIPEETIYHEMGHLQDLYKNIRDEMKLYYYKIPNRSSTLRYIRKRDLDLTTQELIKAEPWFFKKCYPCFYEHIYNKSIQSIAGQVSLYSQESVGEFIAEIYAGLISGRKFSDEIMTLYKNYNGPLLPSR